MRKIKPKWIQYHTNNPRPCKVCGNRSRVGYEKTEQVNDFRGDDVVLFVCKGCVENEVKKALDAILDKASGGAA